MSGLDSAFKIVCEQRDSLQSQLSATQELLREAMGALEFYSNMNVFDHKHDFVQYHSYNPFVIDSIQGKRAIETLTRIRSLHLNPSSKEEGGA